jgi:hypothetical protein
MQSQRCTNTKCKLRYGPVNVIIECEFVVGKERQKLVKELAVLDLKTKQVLCTTFKPPDNLQWNDLPDLCQSQNLYLREQIHGLFFSEGVLPYSELANILVKTCNQYSSGIYTKGSEKACYLSRILEKTVSNLEEIPNLYNANDIELIKLKEISKSKYACFHNHDSVKGRVHCCLNKVHRHKSKLRKYFKH